MSVLNIARHPQQRGLYRLTSAVQIDKPVEEVFAFFSNAQNLSEITPHWMQFQVVTPEPIELRPGQLIDYRLKVHGVPLKWQSEITIWEPPHRFVDEQRKGPYRIWHHEHLFEEQDRGTLLRDQVDYAVPGGGLIHRLFVRRDLEAIFRFRAEKLSQIFPAEPQPV